MTPKPAPYAVDDEMDEATPLSEEERAAVKRAEADILAGRAYKRAKTR